MHLHTFKQFSESDSTELLRTAPIFTAVLCQTLQHSTLTLILPVLAQVALLLLFSQSRMLAGYPFADASKPLCSMTESRLRHGERTAQDSKALLIHSCQEVVLFQAEQMGNPSYSGKTKLNLKFSAPFAYTVLDCTSILLLLTVSREGGVQLVLPYFSCL